MEPSTLWTAVGGVSSAVAAVAALAALVFALVTVRQGIRARTDFSNAHAEAISEMRATQEAALATLAAERTLRQVLQMEQVAEVLADIADVAQREATQPPPRAVGGPEDRARLSLLPAMISRLGAAQAALDALNGPDLPGVRSLVQGGTSGGASVVLHATISCLDEIRLVLQRP